MIFLVIRAVGGDDHPNIQKLSYANVFITITHQWPQPGCATVNPNLFVQSNELAMILSSSTRSVDGIVATQPGS
jgi:hypothetical protein